MTAAPTAVLDTSALLAYLLLETGAGDVAALLDTSVVMSIVNWAETLSKLAELGHDPNVIVAELSDSGILGSGLVIHPLEEDQAMLIARWRPLTRSAGLSLGDRACLALASSLGLTAVTGDRAWSTAAAVIGVDIRLLR